MPPLIFPKRICRLVLESFPLLAPKSLILIPPRSNVPASPTYHRADKPVINTACNSPFPVTAFVRAVVGQGIRLVLRPRWIWLFGLSSSAPFAARRLVGFDLL